MEIEIAKISAPTLLVNLNKVDKNVAAMVLKGHEHNLSLLPHFKTHQSAEIGKHIAKHGIAGITVSSLKMACYFAENGFQRIHLAMAPLPQQRDKLELLAKQIDLTINASSKEHLEAIKGFQIGVLIDIDPEYGRTGIDINNIDEIKRFNELIISFKLEFKGFYIHNGATYNGWIEIAQLHQEIIDKLKTVKEQVAPTANVFYGDTPGCSIAQNFEGVSHLTAGNFVFYDLMQESLGSCFESQIAVCMACPIVEKHEANNEFILHGGAVHFSKDSMLNNSGHTVYGKMVHLNNKGWSSTIQGCEIISLSQEHGILKVTDKVFKQYKVGDVIGILPVHSCLTSDCMRQFISFDNHRIQAIDR